MLTIRKAIEADRRALVSCLLEAFESDFAPFIKQFGRDFVIQFLEKVLVLDRFYIAEVDGELAGTLALTSASHRAVSIDKKELKKSFGRLKTFLLSMTFKEFEEALPFPATTGFFEFVAVKKSFRRQGLASQMMRQVMELAPYKDYVLDVKDSNVSAISCYQKLGFKEFARKPKSRFTRQKDFKELILMEYLPGASGRADVFTS
ncbi:GNAT family N-acetyltransferase [Streptococcus oricebi]|uniref:N-acetyltransferase n=1 Tax=Streptococcus oricebi TaxID=1547447 RepID=A0ABS5B1C1_9STRE|nr:GNAT family N-acetyltransferase [Streptococcus oricebi]MBP2622628.1 N-acetyltransferase [Streptococcus oricebi]